MAQGVPELEAKPNGQATGNGSQSDERRDEDQSVLDGIIRHYPEGYEHTDNRTAGKTN